MCRESAEASCDATRWRCEASEKSGPGGLFGRSHARLSSWCWRSTHWAGHTDLVVGAIRAARPSGRSGRLLGSTVLALAAKMIAIVSETGATMLLLKPLGFIEHGIEKVVVACGGLNVITHIVGILKSFVI